jgi:sugar phosphate isomerase/epimerase
VDWPAFLAQLSALGFQGDLCIEREAGEQRIEDIRAARIHLERLAS